MNTETIYWIGWIASITLMLLMFLTAIIVSRNPTETNTIASLTLLFLGMLQAVVYTFSGFELIKYLMSPCGA